MKFYCEDAAAVLAEVQSTAEGLTAAEAEARLAKNGKNKLAEGKKEPLIKRFLAQLADPMIIILLAAAAISGVLSVVQGESFADVIIILAVVIINAVLGVYQESKAEAAIEALQQMSAATSKVLRDGKLTQVHSEDLVRPLLRIEVHGTEDVGQAPVPVLVLLVGHRGVARDPVFITDGPRLDDSGYGIQSPVEEDSELLVLPQTEFIHHGGVGGPFVFG